MAIPLREAVHMEINPELIAPCGLYCGVCGVYFATRDDNRKFLEKLVNVYKSNIPGMDNLTPEDLLCDGCLSERKSIFCRICGIRDCVQGRGYEGCNICDDRVGRANLDRCISEKVAL